MIETRQLQHFVALAEHLSFARASRVVHLSQSAFSRSIQSLESVLGLSLVARDKRRVELTNPGLMFLQHAREILGRTRELERQVELLRGAAEGVLRVGAGPFPADIFAGEAAGKLLARHPGLQVSLEVSDWATLRQLLKSRSIELFVGETTNLVDDPELHVDVMARHQGYFVVRPGHPLAAIEHPSLAQILEYPLAMVGRLSSRIINGLLESSGRPQRGDIQSIQCAHIPLLRSLIMHCDAVSVFVLPQVEAEARQGSLVVLPVVLPWLTTHFGFVKIRNHTLSPVAAEFKRIADDVNEAAIRRSQELTPLVGRGTGSKRHQRRGRSAPVVRPAAAPKGGKRPERTGGRKLPRQASRKGSR